MIDISGTIEPKSDQLNADDLIAGPAMLSVTGVRVLSGDQPVLIDYEGGQGRPYKPCKSMRRALIHAWGSDGQQYIGRKIIVYNDPTVKWGGSEVGGIRISHLSHIPDKIRMMLTVTRGRRVPFVIEPYFDQTSGNVATPEIIEQWRVEIGKCNTMAELSSIAARIKEQNYDESSRATILQHYQGRVEAIRTQEIDPSKMDHPPEQSESAGSPEGELPAL